MPITRVGIIGGGQLASMLAQAGQPLGLDFHFVEPAIDACAKPYAQHHCHSLHESNKWLNEVDVVTFENENIELTELANIQSRVAIYPDPSVLAISQDRLMEKRFFQQQGIATNAFCVVKDTADLPAAAEQLGLPMLIKTRRFGYDGKGQYVIRNQNTLQQLILPNNPHGYIAEAFVPFDREVSCIGVRSKSGEMAFYDICENTHQDGVLQFTLNRPGDRMSAKAKAMTRKTMLALDYVGVLALELFQCGEQLLANEMAPRVHNTGHWTIEGAKCSQFENHVRAITGLPLGDCGSVGFSMMRNYLGQLWSPEQQCSDWTWHNYGKEPRPGRKLGHATKVQAQPFEITSEFDPK